jgi:hypothetical protein
MEPFRLRVNFTSDAEGSDTVVSSEKVQIGRRGGSSRSHHPRQSKAHGWPLDQEEKYSISPRLAISRLEVLKGCKLVNPAVSLVRAYLRLNGYFTATEVPVIKKGREGIYYESTDIDLLALRFPRASHIVAQGRPGPEDDLHLPPDPDFDIPMDAVDLIIAEVKEGKPRLNPNLLEEDTLYRALVRFGFCPPEQLERAVRDLQERGEAWVRDEGVGMPFRVRIVAFGDGDGNHYVGYTVAPLKHVADYVKNHLKRYRDIMRPIRVTDPTLGLLHLLEKLEED